MSCGKCEEEKPAKKGAAKKALTLRSESRHEVVGKKVEGKCVGCIEHYYSKLGVGIVKLKDNLKVGDKVKIKGHTTEIDQPVDSIQINHADVQEAKKGDVVGIKVSDKVREDDAVYKIE